MTAPTRSFRAIWRVRRRRPDDGAAAVEFALVLPILVLILFGIIDYGLYFNASLQSRWGVHDAARAAAVAPDQGGDTTCDTGIAGAPTDITRLVCGVLNHTDSATAKKYVAVRLPNGWRVNSPLVVCERLDVAGISGFVPFPDNGHVHDVAVVNIEQDDPDPAWTTKLDANQVYEQTLPGGDSWSDWCKP
jgi:Flp pilus assembly pilin Flp